MTNTRAILNKTRLSELFVSIPNFPVKDFIFPDITPILEKDPEIFKSIIDRIIDLISSTTPDYVVCIESFGYVFGIPVAYLLGSKILLARKGGKLPREKRSISYDMVYEREKVLELHENVIKKGDKVIIIDDFLATGGTAKAVISMLKEMGAEILNCTFIVEIPKICGRTNLCAVCSSINSLIDMEFNEQTNQWEVIHSRV